MASMIDRILRNMNRSNDPRIGTRAGRNPEGLFNPEEVLRTNPDVGGVQYDPKKGLGDFGDVDGNLSRATAPGPDPRAAATDAAIARAAGIANGTVPPDSVPDLTDPGFREGVWETGQETVDTEQRQKSRHKKQKNLIEKKASGGSKAAGYRGSRDFDTEGLRADPKGGKGAAQRAAAKARYIATGVSGDAMRPGRKGLRTHEAPTSEFDIERGGVTGDNPFKAAPGGVSEKDAVHLKKLRDNRSALTRADTADRARIAEIDAELKSPGEVAAKSGTRRDGSPAGKGATALQVEKDALTDNMEARYNQRTQLDNDLDVARNRATMTPEQRATADVDETLKNKGKAGKKATAKILAGFRESKKVAQAGIARVADPVVRDQLLSEFQDLRGRGADATKELWATLSNKITDTVTSQGPAAASKTPEGEPAASAGDEPAKEQTPKEKKASKKAVKKEISKGRNLRVSRILGRATRGIPVIGAMVAASESGHIDAVGQAAYDAAKGRGLTDAEAAREGVSEAVNVIAAGTPGTDFGEENVDNVVEGFGELKDIWDEEGPFGNMGLMFLSQLGLMDENALHTGKPREPRGLIPRAAEGIGTNLYDTISLVNAGNDPEARAKHYQMMEDRGRMPGAEVFDPNYVPTVDEAGGGPGGPTPPVTPPLPPQDAPPADTPETRRGLGSFTPMDNSINYELNLPGRGRAEISPPMDPAGLRGGNFGPYAGDINGEGGERLPGDFASRVQASIAAGAYDPVSQERFDSATQVHKDNLKAIEAIRESRAANLGVPVEFLDEVTAGNMSGEEAARSGVATSAARGLGGGDMMDMLEFMQGQQGDERSAATTSLDQMEKARNQAYPDDPVQAQAFSDFVGWFEQGRDVGELDASRVSALKDEFRLRNQFSQEGFLSALFGDTVDPKSLGIPGVSILDFITEPDPEGQFAEEDNYVLTIPQPGGGVTTHTVDQQRFFDVISREMPGDLAAKIRRRLNYKKAQK